VTDTGIEITGGSGAFISAEAEVLAVLLTEGEPTRQKAFAAIDRALGGELSEHLRAVEFEGKRDRVLEIPTLGRLPARRIVLVGLGPKKGLGPAALRAGAAVAARASLNDASVSVVVERSGGRDFRAVAEGLALGSYRFARYLTGERAPKKTLKHAVVFKADGKVTAAEQKALTTGLQVARAVNLARDAVNEPPNVLTPAALAERAQKVAREGKLRIQVLDEKGIQKAGMRLHAAVGGGSAHPPRFIHLTYLPKRAKQTVAFVGKGLTFDSGGLCIKPAAGMEEMKSDMGGAAAVLGLMQAVALLRPNVAVHGIIGAAENMPDGAAYRPADVIRSLDGKTVEIINTDAEGRLVLADALTFARNLRPDLIVDAATLTGACLVALGKRCSAFYTASDRLATQFETAAGQAGELFWRMPLLEELRPQLNSDIADLKHTGERWGGSITATLFLREFVGDVPYIHCDIAGPVLGDQPAGFYPKGGTGHPVLTFIEFVERLG
jgi:leucyl aminopeptidase